MTARTETIESIEARLREEIASQPNAFLPPIAILARQYRVGIELVSRAVQRLRDEGLLVYRKGQRIRIFGREVPPDRPPGAKARNLSATRVTIALMKMLSSASIKAGEPLPKVLHLSSLFHVSEHTILEAIRNLNEQNSVHREGKKWIAGRAVQKTSGISSLNAPFIAVLQARRFSWDGLLAQRTQRFHAAFSEELVRTGCLLTQITTSESPLARFMASAKPDTVTDVIKSMDKLHLGSLIVSARNEMNDICEFVHELSRLNKPVVWFDRYDDRETATRIQNQRIAGFTRCHFSEENGIRTALEFLYQFGHRRIGYPAIGHTADDWIRNRFQLIHDIGQSFPEPIEVAVPPPPVKRLSFRKMPLQELASKLEMLATSGQKTVRRYIDLMLCRVPEFSPSSGDKKAAYIHLAGFLQSSDPKYEWFSYQLRMIHQSGPLLHSIGSKASAIIAPNDTYGRLYYSWLVDSGLRIPQDISLISFDNYYDGQSAPITTIDFGMGYLGYCSFHAILGDVPLNRDRNGNIASQPAVVRRGSVDKPTKRAIHLNDNGEVW